MKVKYDLQRTRMVYSKLRFLHKDPTACLVNLFYVLMISWGHAWVSVFLWFITPSLV